MTKAQIAMIWAVFGAGWVAEACLRADSGVWEGVVSRIDPVTCTRVTLTVWATDCDAVACYHGADGIAYDAATGEPCGSLVWLDSS